jgi:single stranded DNA-binding protein
VNLNRVELVGGLTRDPVLRDGRHGGVFVEVTVAVNGTRWDGSAQVVTTTFVTVLAYGPPADMLRELTKGDEVYVLGELGQREVPKSDGGVEKKTRVFASVAWPTRVHRANGSEVWQ